MILRHSFVGALALVSALAWSYGCSSDDTGASGNATGTGGSAMVSSSSTTIPSVSSVVGSGGAGGSTSSGGATCSVEYTNIPVGECDLLKQDCPSGKFCGVTKVEGVSKSMCLADLGGVKDKGADCSTNSECKSGLSCIDKHCSPFCCPANNEPCGGGSCDVNLNFEDGKSAFAMVCSYLPICDLFAGNCAKGTDCHLTDPASCLAVCDSPSSQAVSEGGKCMYRNDCGESQLCNNNAPDDGVCRYFCDTSKTGEPAGKGGCPADRKCKPAGGTGCMNLGICFPM
ncbi:MAG: hypothetical protein FJ096_01360 [Deltaproteobacteria bacterium]|nr:hypothetical protein [Deltaproteobacteria bacterium]